MFSLTKVPVLNDVCQNLNPMDLIRPISRQQVGACLRNTGLGVALYATVYSCSWFAMENLAQRLSLTREYL
jgi:hypothetical protein